MRSIEEILSSEDLHLSFEVFPPKTSDTYESVEHAAGAIAALAPSFMSVTYGAGGGTSDFTVRLAAELQDAYRLPVLAHLTCISSTREKVRATLQQLRDAGLRHIMALRGDIPKDQPVPGEYHYAADLIAQIRAFDPDICIGGACYPEGHADAASLREDILHIREKVQAGCSFLTTQMFFDNSVYFSYVYKLREAGVDVPVLPGIMPITRKSQITRSVALSGTQIPPRFQAIADRFGSSPAAMQQAGIAYATEQIIDLFANGVRNIHVYSMNKPEVAAGILANVSEILKG